MPELKAAKSDGAKKLQRGTALTLGKAKGSELYIVQLEDPAVPSRHLATDDGDKATTQYSTDKAYETHLRSEHADLRSSISRITGAPAKVRFSYTRALNGLAVMLTRQQAQRVARVDGVSSVQVDFTRELQTDNGPAWIGADQVWDGSAVPGGAGSKGEGIVVGILDSGINPTNPSFADVGGDGYDHTNPRGTFYGMCDPANANYVADWGCNDKLIGYWNLEPQPGGNSLDDPYDDDGHGSHTASTVAGNQVDATAYSAKDTEHEFSVNRTIRGVAPHANIIAYDVCDGGCQGASIVASIEQAILDEVDAINYSIGSSAASNPWDDADAVAFLNARAAGIHVATSAGNDGPGAATLGSPADVPWITSVGATTHDRKYIASVTGLSSEAGPGPDDIAGAGISGPAGEFPLVYAGDAPYNNPLCGIEAPEPNTPDDGDFPAGTDLSGKIIVCDRGVGGRVEKGENVASLGAEGMILANDANSGDSLNGDAHALPASHITYTDGVALKEWMASVAGEKGSLSGSVLDVADANGDIMAAFSSRGPNRAVSLLGPSVSAPGVDILAAAGDLDGTESDEIWEFISGTSMASPHTAGAYALLKAVQPDWTPAQAQSALMTTAERDITDSDGTVADWHDMGSGRIELRRAAKAGLVLDEDKADYLAANPAEGGDVRALNTASMADNDCLSTCEWTRTFDVTDTGAGDWNVSVETMSDDLTLTVDKTSFTAAAGEQVSVTVSAEVAPGASTEDWLYGTLVLTPAADQAPVAHLPVGVLPSNGVLPDEVDITTRRDAGSQVSRNLMSLAIEDLQVSANGLAQANRKKLTIVEDATNLSVYDGNGVHVEMVDVPAGTTRFVAKLENPTAPDFDLYVGKGEMSEANVVCMSASAGSAEGCDIANPEAGNYWVLVQNWEATEPGGSDTTDLVTAVVDGDADNLTATGPEGPLEAREPFDLRVKWDEPKMDAGETWYGSITLGTAPDSAGDIGVIPVQVHRVEDDVTKTADKATAGPGDTITYTVEVQPNVSQEDLTYTITDSLPEGTSYVEGSATNGATYADGVVSWSDTLETAFGKAGSYDFVTSGQDESCVNPYTGDASYLDLEALAGLTTDPDFEGDSIHDTYLGSWAPTVGHFGKQYKGVGVTDDGMLVYGGAANWYQGPGDEPWTVQTLPDPARPNNIMAPLWKDMEVAYDAATNKGVTVATAGTSLAIVEYDDVHVYGEPTQSLDMQVFLFPGSSDVVFAYDNIAAPLTGVTIGAENADGSAASTLVNNGDASSLISNGTVVCATYQPAASTEVEEFSYQVTVDEGVADGTELTNAAVHTTSDPASKPARATSTVTVKGGVVEGPADSAVALTVTPDRFDIGGTPTATATVISSGDTAPTGEVQFLAGDRVAGTAMVGADGSATTTLTGFTTAGTFPVTARYLGDADTAASTSAPVNVVVTAPDAPSPKVDPSITVVTDRNIREGTRPKLKIIITAPQVTPSGTVEVKVRGAIKRKKTYTVTLDRFGTAKLRLSKADLNKHQKKGKIRVKVSYSGDAAVLADKEKLKIRVHR